ncbi:hypothetical protein V501_01853 [Pseudogymnoascus sp. VKM F-4519 (FW-2642)]|nr:hypothetical protein V501_01853 [Pseudogymnoascus sp. VKM F-4519 (FW-2642)]
MDTELHRIRRSRRRSASPESPTRVDGRGRAKTTTPARARCHNHNSPTAVPANTYETSTLPGKECFITNALPRGDSLIMADYRIALVSHNLEYFHISCLENMIDLPLLAPSQFKLDKDGYRWNSGRPWTWGLMLRKWFQHSGCVDLARIAEYIDAYDRFKAELKAFSTPHTKWQLTHLNQCTADRGSCGCPPEPEGPGSSPALEDYKTGDTKACSISEVLQHPYVGRLSTKVVIQGPLFLTS